MLDFYFKNMYNTLIESGVRPLIREHDLYKYLDRYLWRFFIVYNKYYYYK